MRRLSHSALSQAGWTPLICAAFKGHAECVKLLLERGADKEAQGKEAGRTPLMRAALGGHLDCVRLLLEAGADAKARDISGKTALDMVASALATSLSPELEDPRLAATRDLLRAAFVPADVAQLLKSIRLSGYGSALMDIGVISVRDLTRINEEELKGELPEMRLIERRRLLDAAAAWKPPPEEAAGVSRASRFLGKR